MDATDCGFTCFLKAGGEDAGEAMNDHYSDLFRLLSKHMCHRYSRDIDQFDIVLCVDGSVFALGKSGVDQVRVSAQSRRASVNAFFTREEWAGRDSRQLKDLVEQRVLLALDALIKRLTKKNLDFDSDRYRQDLARFLREYRGWSN